jgi:hypothetical protein
MQHKVKKVIAKEFLLLIVIIVIGIICLSFTLLNNLYFEKKAENLQIEIKQKNREVINLVNPLYSKIKQRNWFYNQLNNRANLYKSKYNTPSKLWKRFDELALSDSLLIRYETKWTPSTKIMFAEMGFNIPDQLQKFIVTNRINSTDNLKNKEAENIKKEVVIQKMQVETYHSKILSSEGQNQYLLWSMFISFLALFILRYIYYGIKWSINILKEK